MPSSSSAQPAPPPPPPPPSFSTPQSSAPASSSPQPLMMMARCYLQTFAQRTKVGDPVYETVYEGTPHDPPKFRSTVWVDGKSYTTRHTYSRKVVAEDEAARLALESLTKNIAQEGASLLGEILPLCKAIVNEYAVKLNLERPAYNTVTQQGVIPTFTSSLVFNGSTYVGEAARTKKDADQLAARAVILSNLGNTGAGMMLFQMIKAKYNAIKRNDLQPIANPGHTSDTPDHKDNEVAGPVAEVEIPESSRVLSSCSQLQMPAVSLQPGLTLPINYGSSSKKRRKNKEKANKKPRLESPLPAGFFLWYKSLLANRQSDNVDI